MTKSFLTLALLIISTVLIAQRGIVEGNMTDNTGEPIPGVNIYVKGTIEATVTDLNGFYSIECNVGDILVFSFVGMQSQEMKVTEKMFKRITGEANKYSVPVLQEPVQLLKSDAYADLVNKMNQGEETYSDMNYSPWRWKYSHNSSNGIYFSNFPLSDIRFNDSLFLFVIKPQPLRYEIIYSTTTMVSSVFNLPGLQSEYAQGRPFGGVNTWFGADVNEIFAWGPKLGNLVFDGTSYPYDINGKLMPKDGINTASSRVYNPYNIFRQGIVLNNSFMLRTKRNNNSWEVSYTNRIENEVIEKIRFSANSFDFNFEHKKSRQKWNAGLSYIDAKNNLPDNHAFFTKLMTSVMLTPPSFDNSQGYRFDNGEQRSSAPAFKNNPFFLLYAGTSELQSYLISGHASFRYDWNMTNLGISMKYSGRQVQDNLSFGRNTIGFIGSYLQMTEKHTGDFYLKAYVSNSSVDNLILSTGAILNADNVSFKRHIEGHNPLNFTTGRTSLDFTQNMVYNPDIPGDMEISLKNTIYLAPGHQKWLLPNIAMAYNLLDLLGYSIFNYLNLSADYTLSVAEFPLMAEDISYSTLLMDFTNTDSFLENQELFYTKELELETRQSANIGLNALANLGSVYLDFGAVYSMAKSRNSIFPVIAENQFNLANVGDIRNNSWEIHLKIANPNYYGPHWHSSLIFSRSRSVVEKLYGNMNRIPIAGFQDVSKNLVEGKPVGVIYGSAFQRNQNGQMIIGPDGYPLLDENLKIIADPNPDFYMALENRLRLGKYYDIILLVDGQKGGKIWNGTRNILNYYGLSEESGIKRNITHYIFDGVDQNGQPNTIEVDFANPLNGLDGNRWFRYGPGGVAEEAIEDASWFRIKEIAFMFKRDLQNKFIREFRLKLYVNNLWIFSGYSGISPINRFNSHIQGQGLDYFNRPDKREIGLSLTLKI